MFDIGFSEIVLVGVVSLVVLGPEKLPGAVRTAALMIGRLKRSFNTLKTEIEKEIGADEIRRQLRNEDIMEKFKQTQTVLNNTINSVKEGTEEFRKNVELESQSAGWSSHGGGPAEAPAPGVSADTVPAETSATPAATPPAVGEGTSTVASAETAPLPVNTAVAGVTHTTTEATAAIAPHTDTASTEKSAS